MELFVWNMELRVYIQQGRLEDTRWLVISSTRRRIILCTNAPNVFQPNPFRLFSQNPFWHGGEIWLANPTQIRPVHSLHIELPSLCDQKNHKPPPTASVHPPFALIRKYHWHCRHNLRKSESYWTSKKIEKKIGLQQKGERIKYLSPAGEEGNIKIRLAKAISRAGEKQMEENPFWVFLQNRFWHEDLRGQSAVIYRLHTEPFCVR